MIGERFACEQAAYLKWHIGDVVQTSLRRYVVTRIGFVGLSPVYYGELIAVLAADNTWQYVTRDTDEPLFSSGEWTIVRADREQRVA